MSGMKQFRANLEVASRLGARAVRRKFSGDNDTPPDQQAFREQFKVLLARAPATLVAAHTFVDLPATTPPWVRTGVTLAAGEAVTSFACGRTYLSETLDVWIEPSFQLWFRVGVKGPIFRGTRHSHSFTAEASERLDIASCMPGEWRFPDGELRTPKDDYKNVSGGMCVLLLQWAKGITPKDGVEQLLALGDVDDRVADELLHLSQPHQGPEGWSPLWFIGGSEMFTRCTEGEHDNAICCDTERDFEVLQKDVDVPFTDDAVLEWSWKVDALPSKLREDTLPTHDYMGLAVEYDNGQDISYMWSADLPTERHFPCPLPTWRNRQTIWVVRSGTDALGAWVRESRTVAKDYHAAVQGLREPRRIVRIWLIGISLFQRLPGRCTYANIRLKQGETQLTII